MSTLYGDNHKKNFIDRPVTKSEPGLQRGEVRMSEDYFSADAVAVAGDVIKLQRIPQGARIVDMQVFNPAGNASAVGGNADLGWSASEDLLKNGSKVGLEPEAAVADGFFAALDLSDDASMDSIKDLATLPAAFAKKFTEDVFVTATITTDTVATDGSKLGVRVFYVED